MLGVGDAISPDFCLTIPRHWARSLAARGIEPLRGDEDVPAMKNIW